VPIGGLADALVESRVSVEDAHRIVDVFLGFADQTALKAAELAAELLVAVRRADVALNIPPAGDARGH
jgi:hypothetical protein